MISMSICIGRKAESRSGSLPHLTCSSALFCAPAVGGAVSWCAPWAYVGFSDGAVGRSPSSCRQFPSFSPHHSHITLIPFLLVSFTSISHWRFFISRRISLSTAILRWSSLVCSTIAGIRVIISSACLHAKLSLWSTTETKVSFLV